jgi:hypothetical protein
VHVEDDPGQVADDKYEDDQHEDDGEVLVMPLPPASSASKNNSSDFWTAREKY